MNGTVQKAADYLIAHGVTLVEENKILTNADRIRAMSDEDLAEWVVFQTGYRESAFSEMTYFNILTGNDDNRKDAEKAMYTWLKQPAKEETK